MRDIKIKYFYRYNIEFPCSGICSKIMSLIDPILAPNLSYSIQPLVSNTEHERIMSIFQGVYDLKSYYKGKGGGGGESGDAWSHTHIYKFTNHFCQNCKFC